MPRPMFTNTLTKPMSHWPWPLLLVLLAASVLLSACNQPPDNVTGTGIYKIRVAQEGIHRLVLDQFAGLPADQFNMDDLSLMRDDEAVPFTVSGEGRMRALYFYAAPRIDQFADYDHYWLQLRVPGKGTQAVITPAAPLASRAVRTAATVAESNTPASVRVAEDKLYVPKLPAAGDHWVWAQLNAPTAMTVTVPVQHMVDISHTLHVTLWSITETGEDPDHHVVIRLNGQSVHDGTWNGRGLQEIEVSLPTGLLKEGSNEVVLSLPGDTGAVVDTIAVEAVQLDYTQAVIAEENNAAWWAAADQQDFSVGGFDSEDVQIWDVSDPINPAQLTGYAVERDGVGYAARFADDTAGDRRYVAVTPGAMHEAVSVTPWQGPDLHHMPQGGDYIIVTHPDFVDALQPLVAQRQANGLRVVVVTTEQVYNTFSNGRPDPQGIKDFLYEAYRNWPTPAPRFVMLVGDASYDYLDRLQGKYKDLVPTHLLDTTYVGETASDNWFVRFGSDPEDYRPSMAIGRLPAQDVDQVKAMVDKILRYEQNAPDGDWRTRALLVADDDETTFTTMSDILASDYLTNTYQVEKVYIGETPDPNAAVLRALNEGVSFVNYVGHGSLDVWGAEKALKAADLAKIENADGRWPLLVTMTCLTGYFHHPNAESLGELLLRAPDKGIVAALVPTSESITSHQQPLAEAFYRELFGDEAVTIGEAMMRAKQAMPENGKMYRDVIETFNLLGDPAMHLVPAVSGE